MNKKVFILTHPLTGNYGGLLQAYASYTALSNLAYTPYIYRYTAASPISPTPSDISAHTI